MMTIFEELCSSRASLKMCTQSMFSVWLEKQDLHETALPASVIHVWPDENPHAILQLRLHH